MRIIEVTEKDGISLAYVLRALTAAHFDHITGKDMEAFAEGKKWIQALAIQVADQLTPKKREVPPPVADIKVTKMGILPRSKSKKKGK